jgi:hypothetical protein
MQFPACLLPLLYYGNVFKTIRKGCGRNIPITGYRKKNGSSAGSSFIKAAVRTNTVAGFGTAKNA